MKKNNKKSKNPVVLTLYGISIFLGVYTIFTIYNSFEYISSLVSQGLVISDELRNIIIYFMEASMPYLFYAISIWAIGYIINKLNHVANEIKISNNKEVKEEIIHIDSNNEIACNIEEEEEEEEEEEDDTEDFIVDSNNDTK